MSGAPTSNIYPGAVISYAGYDYEIGAPFDVGGFGRVYHATRRGLIPVSCVVKVPLPAIANEPILRAKFKREASIIANISHTNVVASIAFWEFEDEELALVQALVPNARKLGDYLQEYPKHAPSVYLQVLYALNAMHPEQIHRDLSPSNILVDSETGIVKVIDFGLAKDISVTHVHMTRTGVFFGTPGCMSPEQASDVKHVDHRTDLYALGRSMASGLQRRDPSWVQPWTLDEPWKTICQRLTDHDPDARYADANEAIDHALQLFGDHCLTLTNFEHHAAEVATGDIEPTTGWPSAVQSHVDALPDLGRREVRLLAALPAFSFAGAFDSGALLSRLESESALHGFVHGGHVSFEHCDPIGALYWRIYPNLNPADKERCFRRVCQVAVGWNRYVVMEDVRKIFALERDPKLRAVLLRIIDEEDPARVIHGRGDIPGRVP